MSAGTAAIHENERLLPSFNHPSAGNPTKPGLYQTSQHRELATHPNTASGGPVINNPPTSTIISKYNQRPAHASPIGSPTRRAHKPKPEWHTPLIHRARPVFPDAPRPTTPTAPPPTTAIPPGLPDLAPMGHPRPGRSPTHSSTTADRYPRLPTAPGNLLCTQPARRGPHPLP